MAQKRNRLLDKSAAEPKKKFPAHRRRAKQEEKNQIHPQAVVLHNRATRSRQASMAIVSTPAINSLSSRPVSRAKLSGNVANLNTTKYNEEHANSEDELVVIRSDVPRRAATPFEPRKPQREKPQTPQRSSKQKTPVAQFGLLTPPNSASSSRIQKTVKKTVSKKKVSDFHDNLATAYRVDNDNEVVITGTQVNIKSTRRPHSWTADERKVLCVLKRFFSADVQSLTAVLNGIFPKALVPFTAGMVNMQHTEIRVGKQCSAESDGVWETVWGVADFGTACQNFRLILERIEETASEVGAPMSRRFDEDHTNAKCAESRKVVLQNRPIKVREAPNTSRRMTDSRHALLSPMAKEKSMSGQLSQRGARSQTASLAVVPVVEVPTIRNELQSDADVPTLLFRAFSSASFGINSEERFRADQFKGRPNAVPPPEDPNNIRFAWDVSSHLSQSGDIASKIATPLISLSASLVWCIQKLYKIAGDDDSKKFAIINGPLADLHTRLYRAGPILQRLKNIDMYNKDIWYKASMEWLAWGEIRREAISTVIGRQHLEMLARASPAVNAVLRLDVLERTNNMFVARAEFHANPVHLDGRVGMAIGKLCLLFGISFQSDQAVITELIFHILQGWAIKIDVEDDEELQQAFSTFVGQLESSDKSVALAKAISTIRPKLREAFYRGVQQAAQELLKEKSKRAIKRTRYNRRAICSRT